MSILDKLNDMQRKAGEKIEGPLLILAGAGSGKTRTITYRIAHMISELGISPYKILAVTFTNKAAGEMRERVESLVGEEGKRAMISTFHSFGVRLLRIYGDRLGYTPNFTIYDADDQKKLISNILKEIHIGDGDIGTPKQLVSFISKLKEEGTSPADFISLSVQNQKNKMIGEVYSRYNLALKSNGAMDFSDILLNTLKLLKISDILAKVQDKFRYIMIDEYQDTNDIQYQIVNIIANKYKNICVVGDENQSIYGFRGANIQNILNFEKDYPDATVIKLEENYRSTSPILTAANSVIANNTSSRDKKLWTKRDSREKIAIKSCDNPYGEADFVVRKIAEKKIGGANYRDFTILYRLNSQSRAFEEKLISQNIPYKVFGGINFYQRAEVKDILAYLFVINNPLDNLNLERIINVPKRKIGAKTLEKIYDFAKTNNLTLLDALKRANEVGGISANLKTTLLDFANVLDEFISSCEVLSVAELTEKIIDDIGYFNYLESNYSDDYEDRISNIEELLGAITSLEEANPDITLREYLENISLVSATDNLDEKKDYVKLMTIHNSKGLEFPNVFLVGAEEGYLPGTNADFDNDELEESRRLCYVAITRAEDKLFITHSKKRMLYGQSEERTPSRFINEIPNDVKDDLDEVIFPKYSPKKENFSAKHTFKKMITLEDLNRRVKDLPYSIGQRVSHPKFGVGTVRNVEENKVEIDFSLGRKKIAMTMAEKILTKC